MRFYSRKLIQQQCPHLFHKWCSKHLVKKVSIAPHTIQLGKLRQGKVRQLQQVLESRKSPGLLSCSGQFCPQREPRQEWLLLWYLWLS